MKQYYTPSGQFSPMSFILWIAAALIVFPLLAAVYAYAIWYIPFPYINFFVTAAFGFALGLAISFLVIKLGKVRNGKLTFVFCLFGALTALYIHWAVWVDLAFNVTDTIGTDRIGIATSNINIAEVLGLALNPQALFSVMGEINEVGVWGFRGGTVSGGFLTFIWIVEIVIVVIVTIVTGSGQENKPFCELENKWFDENHLPPVSHFENPTELVSALSLGDIDVLNTMLKPAGDIKTEHHGKIILYDAKSGENFVSVVNEMAGQNEKGEIKFESKFLTNNLKISQEVADRLKS